MFFYLQSIIINGYQMLKKKYTAFQNNYKTLYCADMQAKI